MGKEEGGRKEDTLSPAKDEAGDILVLCFDNKTRPHLLHLGRLLTFLPSHSVLSSALHFDHRLVGCCGCKQTTLVIKQRSSRPDTTSAFPLCFSSFPLIWSCRCHCPCPCHPCSVVLLLFLTSVCFLLVIFSFSTCMKERQQSSVPSAPLFVAPTVFLCAAVTVFIHLLPKHTFCLFVVPVFLVSLSVTLSYDLHR